MTETAYQVVMIISSFYFLDPQRFMKHRCDGGVLREHPSENHAVLNYESTSALSDFVQILCRVT